MIGRNCFYVNTSQHLRIYVSDEMAGRVFGKYAELISKESCQRQAFCALSSEMEAFCELFWTIGCSFWGFFFFLLLLRLPAPGELSPAGLRVCSGGNAGPVPKGFSG